MEIRTHLHFRATQEWKKLDFFLKANGISKKIITQLKYIDCLKINGIPTTTIQPVHTGDIVTLIFPQETELSCAPQPGAFEILYEDKDILAVDKPYGIATHPAAGTKDRTLGNFVSQYYLEHGFQLAFRPVSRLDKDTSGVIVIAKNKLAHHSLSEQMKNNQFQKQYLALVTGIPKQAHGEITFPIAREAPSSLLRTCRSDGKPAHTIFRMVDHTATESLLELELKTGRTHQIRVHLQAIGHPIIGDCLYGVTPADRLYLHSYLTTFFHPVTKERIQIKAPCPFGEILHKRGT